VFFCEEKGETFGFVRDLVLRLRNEGHGDAIRAIYNDNASEFKNSRFETFCHDLGLEHCWRLKHVTTFDPQAYGLAHFSPWGDPQGSCQSVEQGDR
jgi:hypothetical protein